jgi:hypothetical protein
MDKILKYLTEKKQEFFPEEEPEDSVAELEDDYGLDFIDDEDFITDEIEVEKIPDNSDPILNADEFMNSNSKLMSLYADGKGFNLTDNLDLYEVIKLVKDLTDKHFYFKDLVWKADIANRKVVITFKLGNGKEENDFFLQGVKQYILTQIFKKFGSVYTIDTEFLKNTEKQDIMKLTVFKNISV